MSEEVITPQNTEGKPFEQKIIINQVEKRGNGIGTTGFILAILALLLCWVPVLDWILWILGAIFSIVGLFRKPKGLAIAGVVISFIGVIVMITLASVLFAALM